MIPLITLLLLPISNVSTTSEIIVAGPNKITLSYQNNLREIDIYRKFKIPSRNLVEKHYFDSPLTLDYPHTSNHILYLEDKDNNIKGHPFTLEIIDDISPIIYGPNIIEYDYQLLPSTTEFLKNYTSYDEIDLSLPISIDRNIEDIVTKPGSYTFTLTSEDYSYNISSKLISLKVKDTKKVPFHINEYVVKTKVNEYLSPEMLSNSLIKQCFLENKEYSSYTYILDEYSNNYHKEGVYLSILQIIDDYHIIEIKVKFINEKEVLHNKTSLIDILINSCKNFISWISKLIENIIWW